MRLPALSTLPLLVLLFVAFTSSPAYAVNFFLRTGEETCFSHDVIRGEHILGEFKVLPEGSELAVTVKDSLGVLIYQKPRVSEGRFAYTSIENGEYKACFSNQAEHGEGQKTVKLKFTTGAEAQQASGGARKKNLKPLEVQVKHLEEVISGIRQDEVWMAAKQEKMRKINDSTASRVLWFNILSLIVLVGAHVVKIWYLRRYFKQKKLVVD